MSTKIQQGLLILIILVAISVGFAVFMAVAKMGVDKQNVVLQSQLGEEETRSRALSQEVKKAADEAQSLRKEIEQKTGALESVGRKADELRQETDRLNAVLSTVQRDKTDIEGRLAVIRRERDELVEKVKATPQVVEKVVEKNIYLDMTGRPLPADYQPGTPLTVAMPQAAMAASAGAMPAGDEYWAGVVRQKAALEIELADVKRELGASRLKISELSRGSSDTELELGRLRNEHEELVRKIKYGEDLADNLSIELARARNDQRSVAEQSGKVMEDNEALRAQLKELSSTKVALEKSIARLTEEKASVEKKLASTEDIIQSRIDEILRIKKDIDARFQVVRETAPGIELAPIVVSPRAEDGPLPAAAPRQGTVVSVNETNGFVVIDMGEKDGIRVGDAFKVVRGEKEIGTVSVIQVRRDIAAADIKQSAQPLKAGDLVR